MNYAPEDTLKSAIFFPKERPSENGEGAAKELQEDEQKSEEKSILEWRSQRPMECRKPATFLRRRQGISAWCSKIRKQGLPTPDPAEELRKRRTSNSLASPSLVSTGPSRLKANSVYTPRAQSAIDCGTSLKKSNTLWCGLEHRMDSSGSPQSDEQQTSLDHLISHSPLKVNPIAAPCTAPELRHSQATAADVDDEHRNDAGDLEEFEFLEEIAENSSFSSLTTSFVAKLGKNRLKDRLKCAEKTLEKLISKGTGNGSEDTPGIHGEQNSSSQMDAQTICHERLPERSILAVLDKHRTRRNSEQFNLAGDRTTDKILTEPMQNKGRKIARFQFAQDQSQVKDDNKFGDVNDANYSKQEPEKNVLASNDEKKDSKENRLRNSSEFDDGNSWTCSTLDLNETGRPKLSSAFDLSIPNALDTDGARVSENHDCDHESRLNKRPISKSPSLHNSCGRSEDYLASIPSQNRAITRPLSASGHLGSRSTRPTRPLNSSYEDELINLADDFMEQLKRDQPSPGRSTTHMQTLVRQWVLRLEAEVRRFKTENATLLKLRSERDESLRRLEMEAKRFEEYKSREIRSLTEMKENEMRKLKKERRILEDYERALKAMPNKKDREEIERLKEELLESRSDLSRREVRWHAAIARLRSRIEELEGERDELKDRLRRLEEERISLHSQLSEFRASGRTTKAPIRRSASSIPSLRHTLSSVAQSISLKTSTISLGGQKESCLPDAARRSRQQQQYLSSCRLSGRLPSQLDPVENIRKATVKRTATPTHPGPESSEMTSVQGDHPMTEISPILQQAIPSTAGARESVISGGYFTGDDDGASSGSTHLAVQQSGVNLAQEQTIAACTTMTRSNEPSLHAAQIMSPLAKSPTPTVQTAVLAKSTKPQQADEKLPSPHTAASGSVTRTVKHADGSVEETYSNGAVVVTYFNGSVKEVFPDGVTIVVSLFNGDIKRTMPDGRVIYSYAADGTVQTTYPDGTEEINYADGRQEIIHVHPKSTSDKKLLSKCPTERQFRQFPNGDREIRLPNGQREVHSASGVKCRIYPDGTTKTVFPDGRHETRYASGRLRVKDSLGNLLLDTRLPAPNRLFPDPPCNLSKASSLLPVEHAP